MTVRFSLVLANLLALVASIPLAARIGQDVAATVIARDLQVRESVGPCDAATTVGMIAMATGVPAGVEHVPGACDYRNEGPRRTSRSLEGLTVREALDSLVQSDPRYRWALVDGVISFRPIAAANLSDHFLHTATGSLELVDTDMSGALAAVLGILRTKYQPPPTTRTPEAARRFSISVPSITALDALDEIVRRHGAMWWEVQYCKGEALRRYATVNLWTFDKSGLGMRIDQSFRASGSVDPCDLGSAR